ncbi:MAG: ATP-binding protein, partial [Kitasatospora sp.]|nr:ATP-binding protein [Kitasatospora sp.]
MAEPAHGTSGSPIEVVPVVVVSQSFPARPSFIPEIRDFVRRCLADSPLDEDGVREVGETVFRALLDAAGPTGFVQVAFRIFPEHVEVDVLHSESQVLDTAGTRAQPAPAAQPVS